eukprot:522485-Rhodomonas_salina.1
MEQCVTPHSPCQYPTSHRLTCYWHRLVWLWIAHGSTTHRIDWSGGGIAHWHKQSHHCTAVLEKGTTCVARDERDLMAPHAMSGEPQLRTRVGTNYDEGL